MAEMADQYFIERLSGRFKIHHKGTGSGTEQIATADSEEDATLITSALNERERLRAALRFQRDALDNLCDEGLLLPPSVHAALANMRDDVYTALDGEKGGER